MSGNAATPTRAVVFDFDGVLLDSVDVKTQAFAAIYAPYGKDIVDQVVAYHQRNGGLSRYVKFSHFHEKLLNIPLPETELQALGERFSRMVEDAVVASPWVPGAREVLDALQGRLPLFVASGTPQEELRRIVERRGLSGRFAGVYGSPDTKGRILSRLAGEYGASNIVMVGDSITDLEGADEAKTRFVGRMMDSENPFPERVPVVRDLRELLNHL